MRMRQLMASALLLSLGYGGACAGELTVYTALEADQMKPYKDAFEAANPGITLNWVRDSTGVVTAKLLAEKAAPVADVVMGLAATSLMFLDKEGMLQGYAPKGLEAIPANYRDPANPPKWVGMDVWSSALCFKTVEEEDAKLPKPTAWVRSVRTE